MPFLECEDDRNSTLSTSKISHISRRGLYASGPKNCKAMPHLIPLVSSETKGAPHEHRGKEVVSLMKGHEVNILNKAMTNLESLDVRDEDKVSKLEPTDEMENIEIYLDWIAKPVRQKKSKFSEEKVQAIRHKTKKLLGDEHIQMSEQQTKAPTWWPLLCSTLVGEDDQSGGSLNVKLVVLTHER
ncbi:hypothetical protein V6N11_063185 [Hibiscus sabdariffa]|uniref:Uncharacterized protein n=1 Tax=Hibiscus sabdariffa TaxID=183260 RepID=A0ABR2NWR6_9ROSI